MGNELLRDRLAGFIERKANLGIKQLTSSGETSELPIRYQTIEALVFSAGDRIGFKYPVMIALITEIAAAAGLEPVGDHRDAWDLPANVKSKLLPKSKSARGESVIDIPYKPPRKIILKKDENMPKARVRARKDAGADRDYNDPTYRIDDY